MPVYVYRILGENFLIQMNGQEGKYGFFHNVVVEAPDTSTGEEIAIQQLRDHPKLKDMVKNLREDPPTLTVDGIGEIDSTDRIAQDQGFIWFEMNPKRWWQFWRR